MSETREAVLWRVRQVALRSDLRIALARDEPVARVLERCADALVDHLDVAVAAFWLVDQSGAGADLIAVSRVAETITARSAAAEPRGLLEPVSRPERPPGMPQRVTLSAPGIGAIISELSPRVTEDLHVHPELVPVDLVASAGLASFAGFPLLGSNRPAGALALYARSAMAPDALEVTAWVADLISITLESRRRGEELREALAEKQHESVRRLVAQQHTALEHRVSRLLATARSFGEAAPDLVRELAQSLGWEVGALWHLEVPPNLRQVTVWHGPDRDLAELADHLRRLAHVPESGVVSEVLRTGGPVYLSDAGAAHIAEDLPGRRTMRCAFGLPVVGEGVVLGVLVFLGRAPRPVDEELGATLVALAAQVGQFLRRKQVEELLFQSQKMEAVGKLAGGVAHDFNNILTVITGYAAMALEQVPQEHPVHEQAHEILSAAERATSLVNQLLAFSRKQMFHPRVLDLNIVVGDMERMLRRLIGEDIRLITRKPDQPSMVRADLVHVEQVVVNLAVNARDAMPQGGRLYVEIGHVKMEPPVPDGATHGACAFVRVVVRDTGLGMSEEVRSHVFEPFFTTKDAGRGTGLGLATVHRIVRQNGGHIRVDSESGKGAQFTILFPRLAESASAAAARDTRVIAARGHETILLVEDEKPVRRLARHILKSAGYEVIEAGSGEEALQICARAERPFQLLLTDVVMPGMNGVELSRRLRGNCANLRVLYMSGYAEDALFDGYAMGRGVAFLEKPFTPAGLAQRVRLVLDAAGAGAGAPEKAGGSTGCHGNQEGGKGAG